MANLSEESAAKDRRIADLEAHVAELEAARLATGAGDLARLLDLIADHLRALDDDARRHAINRLLEPFDLVAESLFEDDEDPGVRVERLKWEKAGPGGHTAHVMSEAYYPYYILSPSKDDAKLFGLSLVTSLNDDGDETIIDEDAAVSLAKAKKRAQEHHEERGA